MKPVDLSQGPAIGRKCVSPHPPSQDDPCWTTLQHTAAQWVHHEPLLAQFLRQTVLGSESFEACLSSRLAAVFSGDSFRTPVLRDLISGQISDHQEIGQAARADLHAICANDPATDDLLTPFLFLKGFAALCLHRIAHRLWLDGRYAVALALQQRMSDSVGGDIRPRAVFGEGILLDHATGIVVGETAIVGDDVTMFHGVTLGGTGKQRGDRHPKIGRGAFIGAGANILGNLRVGEWSRVGAGSVVLDDVPSFSLAVGVPAVVSAITFEQEWPDKRALREWNAGGTSNEHIVR